MSTMFSTPDGKYIILATTDPRGQVIQVKLSEAPSLVKVVYDGEAETEEVIELPPAASSFLKDTPLVEFFVKNQVLTEVLYDLIDFSIFEGPAASVAAVRKRILCFVAANEIDEGDEEFVPPTLAELRVLDECMKFIFGEKFNKCGCGRSSSMDSCRCQACGAPMCEECAGFQFCSGCFNLLSENAELAEEEGEGEWP